MKPTRATRICLKAMFVLALFTLATDAAAVRRYVDADATGGNSGINWADAFTDLQTALFVALPGDEIWVAEGTYYPTSVNDRDAYFDMKAQVSLYGGFNATETMLSERDWVAHPTILSGEIGTSAATDNSYTVVRIASLNTACFVDGFTITRGYANGNYPGDRGGGMWIYGSYANIRNVLFDDNQAESGGAVSVGATEEDPRFVTVTNTTFTDNRAFQGVGGAAAILGGDVAFDSVTVDSNTAVTSGGGITILYDYGDVTITNSSFTGNLCVNLGGGAVWGRATITGCEFTGNLQTAVITDGPVSYSTFINNSGVTGGALENGGTVNFCTFQGNTATNFGGAVFAKSGPISNSTFISNTATASGGAIFTDGDASAPPLKIALCDFTSNGAQDGGAVFATGLSSAVEINDCTFDTNTASNQGGAVWGAATTTVNRSEFTGNTADFGGAAAHSVSGSECTFEANSAEQGGAVWLREGTFDHSTFRGNQATQFGGAVAFTFVLGCTLTTCEIDSNTAPDGGGVYISYDSPSSVLISDSEIHDNTALRGGGVFVEGFGLGVEVDRCELHGNEATVTGGGVYNASDITLSNSVLHLNTADFGGGIADLATATFYTNLTLSENAAQEGGGIWTANGTPEIRNCILWDDAAPIGPEIHNTGAPAIVGNSIVQGSGGSGGGWDPSVGTDDGGNLDADPLFINPPLDYDTGPGSPVIEAGDDAAVGYGLLDFAGGQRVRGFVIDIGAYESGFFCPTTTRLYVDVNAVGSGSGVDWPGAFVELRDAFTIADQCPIVTEVWVAQGTYYPTDQSDSFASFVVRPGLSIYGGFAGTEVSLAQRDLANASTILSGEIGSPVPQNNSYHVVVVDSTDSTTVIDGFTITGGYADGVATIDRSGAGIRAIAASPRIRNVTLADHFAEDGGAGYYGTGGEVVMTNVVVLDNVANGNGAGVFAQGSTLSVTNGSFTRNSGVLSSALYATTSNVTIANCIFWGDTASILYPELALGASATISSSIVAGSGGSGGGWVTIIGQDGGGNLDLDPLYVDPSNQDLRLQSSSPAIDAGDGAAPDLPAVDRDNLPRVAGAEVDMGAYEFVVTTAIGDAESASPAVSRIESASPNPFNPTLTVVLAVAEAGPVEVSVYDVRGARVRRIWSGPRQAGRFAVTWDARTAEGGPAASGVYFIRLETVGAVNHRKVVLLK